MALSERFTKREAPRFAGPHRLASSAESSRLLLWLGRLDNRRELLQWLGDRLHHGSDNADIALATYGRDGVKGLARLIGDWSLVIHDGANDLIILASDYAGAKPLYYGVDRQTVRWDTSLRALIDRAPVADIDEQFAADFLATGGSPSRTPFSGVRSVPPGHAICIGPRSVTDLAFWTAPTRSQIRYEDERRYEDECRQLCEEAVAVRLDGTAPMLAELSGGLDSSTVVCLADRLMASPSARLQTVSYLHDGSLDAPFIRAVEDHRGRRGTHLSLATDPLFGDTVPPGAMPQDAAPLHRAVARIARGSGAHTILTGQLGDLVFANWMDDSAQIAGHLRHGRLASALKDALEWSAVTQRSVYDIVANAVTLNLLPSRLVKSARLMCDGSGPQLIEPAFIRRVRAGREDPHACAIEWRDAPVERRASFLMLAAIRRNQALRCPEALADVDYTHPFAHRPLVEFLMTVPADILCRPGEPRRLMRRALGHLWPAALRQRRSKSLLAGEYLKAFRPLAVRLLRETTWQISAHGWVNRERLTAALRRVALGVDCPPQVRHALLLEHWLSQQWNARQDKVS